MEEVAVAEKLASLAVRTTGKRMCGMIGNAFSDLGACARLVGASAGEQRGVAGKLRAAYRIVLRLDAGALSDDDLRAV